MDYLNRLNQALDYIEKNLDGDIDLKKAASLACCSVAYFQRVFSFIADMPLSEYIRRRRMTKAAFELKNSGIKVIDLALKYGYDSPDSFSRAFQSVHGILPSLARSEGVTVKAFPRIAFLISIKGDVEMNYRIEQKEAFRIVGVKRHYKGPENDESVVPVFWNELYSNGTVEVLNNLSSGIPGGVHGFIQASADEKVDYTIACITDKEPPAGMESYIVPKATWAIFEIDGPVHKTMATAWKRIFTEWLPTSNYSYAETVDIECFPNGENKGSEDYKYEIWLPVKEKDK